MVVHGDILIAFVTFRGDQPDVLQYNYNEASDTWSYVFNTGMQTTIGPSAALLGADLYVTGVDGDGRVHFKKYDSQLGWQNDIPIDRWERGHLIATSGANPYLLLLGSQYGHIGPNQIRFDRTVDGVTLEDLGRINDLTKERPHGIRSNGSSVELVYRGTNNRLYLTTASLPAN